MDYRDFDLKVLMLEEYPVLTMTFQTNEIYCFRDSKGKVVLGGPDNLRNVRYAIAFTKRQLVDPEAEYDASTGGWVVMQFASLAM